MLTTTLAAMGPQGMSKPLVPPRLATPAVTVLAVSRVMNVSASRNSFHAAMKINMPVVASAGAASGKMMRKRI